MVTRFKYAVLITLLLAPFSSPAMEESHAEYMIVVTNELAEDYETLACVFSQGEAPSLQALEKYPSNSLDRGEEVFAPFVLIRELLQRRRGHEERLNLPTSSASNTLLGVKLTFVMPVPVSAFPEQQFDGPDEGQSRLPTIIAGKTAITAYQLKLTHQYREDFQPGSSPPYPNDPHGLKPWHRVP